MSKGPKRNKRSRTAKTKYKSKRPVTPIDTQENPQQESSRFKYLRVYLTPKRILNGALLLITIAGVPLTVREYNKWKAENAATEHDRFNKQRWIYIPPITGAFYSGGPLHVDFGGIQVKHYDFERYGEGGVQTTGVPIEYCDSSRDGDPPTNISLSLKNNNFVFSAKLLDLKTGALICEVVDNVARIDKDITDYNFGGDGKKAIEIIDKYGYVAFQMWVDDENIFRIRGYFVGPSCIIFVNDGVIKPLYRKDPDFQRKLVEYASILKPKFTSLKN